MILLCFHIVLPCYSVCACTLLHALVTLEFGSFHTQIMSAALFWKYEELHFGGHQLYIYIICSHSYHCYNPDVMFPSMPIIYCTIFDQVFIYHKAFPMPVLSYKFSMTDPISGHEFDDASQFISCVCWRGRSSTLLAANSSGNIRILEMVWLQNWKQIAYPGKQICRHDDVYPRKVHRPAEVVGDLKAWIYVVVKFLNLVVPQPQW